MTDNRKAAGESPSEGEYYVITDSGRRPVGRRQFMGLMGAVMAAYAAGCADSGGGSAPTNENPGEPPTNSGLAIFLKIDGVVGESTDTPHRQEIDILAWSWGGTQSGTMRTGGGGGGGKVTTRDLALTKYVDKASTVLFRYLAEGRQFTQAKLTVRQAGGSSATEFLVITMKEVIVTSLSLGGSGGQDRLTETIALNFAQFQVTYVPQDPAGGVQPPVTFGWDIGANHAI
jgi:type VI secretion system secreted protein Hcp